MPQSGVASSGWMVPYSNEVGSVIMFSLVRVLVMDVEILFGEFGVVNF
jgi:hypothetical protein